MDEACCPYCGSSDPDMNKHRACERIWNDDIYPQEDRP